MPFQKESLDFLVENRLRDDKQWFNAHRDSYEKLVLQPMRELVTALTPSMLAIDPAFVTEPKIGKTISRVWRDTRYTHDKSLFRDHLWCSFTRKRQLFEGLPCFFFELSPQGVQYGCGYYQASSDVMQALRELILADAPCFIHARDALNSQTLFTMEDARYKRSRFSDRPAEQRLWLDQRNICFLTGSKDFSFAFSDKLAERLSKDLTLLKPLYELLMQAEARKPRKEQFGHDL